MLAYTPAYKQSKMEHNFNVAFLVFFFVTGQAWPPVLLLNADLVESDLSRFAHQLPTIGHLKSPQHFYPKVLLTGRHD